jgi:PAS domain S-box-containing protein
MIWICGHDALSNYFNRTWLQFTGRTLEEEIGMGWTAGVHPEDLPACLDAYNQAMDSGKPGRVEYRHRRYDGKYRWLLDQFTPRYEGGEFRGLIGYRIEVDQRRASEQAVRELSGQLINAQEAERARIARDLHDNVGQRIAMLSIDVELIKQGLPESDVALRKQLDSIYQHTADLSKEIRHLSHQLHSAMLDHVGLLAATRELCQQVSQQHGISIDLIDQDVPDSIANNISLCLFRVLQEGLNNLVKHSGAERAKVELSGCDGILSLKVSDAGRGFDHESRKRGLGLISMKERLQMVGGELSLHSAPGAGTEIKAEVRLFPVEWPKLPRPRVATRPRVAIGAFDAQAARAVGR